MTTADANGNYDFSGAPTLAPGSFLNNPFAGTPFQCQPGTSTPEPVDSTGTQTSGADCNIIPAAVVNPDRRQSTAALSHAERQCGGLQLR